MMSSVVVAEEAAVVSDEEAEEYEVSFENRRLGLKLILVKDEEDVTSVIVEETTTETIIMPRDVLLRVDGVQIGDVRPETFVSFVATLARRERPMALTFKHGSGRKAALKRQHERQKLARSSAALEQYERQEQDGRSAYNAAMLRANGVGCEAADLGAAMLLLRKAAHLGVTRAQSQLGSLYATGRGGFKRDDDEALRWYTAAAAQSASGAEAADAHYALGTMHRLGLGTARDDAAALYHWTRAATHGHDHARIKAQDLVAAKDREKRQSSFFAAVRTTFSTSLLPISRYDRLDDDDDLFRPINLTSRLFGGSSPEEAVDDDSSMPSLVSDVDDDDNAPSVVQDKYTPPAPPTSPTNPFDDDAAPEEHGPRLRLRSTAEG